LDELEDRISKLFRRLAAGRLEPDDIVALPAGFEDASPQSMDDLVSSGRVHDPEILPFGRLTAEMGTIFDIGAHWGYTAAGIRSAGSDCPIISFEALAEHQRALMRLREIDPGYDYRIGPLGDRRRSVTLYNVLANDRPVFGINSVDGTTLIPSQAKHIAAAARAYCPGASTIDVKIAERRLETDTLDRILQAHAFRLPVDRIAAMKIDVEGYERNVVLGAKNTIAASKPLLLIEYNGIRNPILADLKRLGYRRALRDEDRLKAYDGSLFLNGYYFYHPARASEYQAVGLIA
jgi:FkbM family methyltransferase